MGYKYLKKSEEKINHLIYMDDIKLFKKIREDFKTKNKNIQPRYRNVILFKKYVPCSQ